ncbi:hypothetical protein [Methylotuvimicrobium sp.]|uniref:hypothetical protein n=1 Tax=Methylotuvimicrobium sp. TaxID=2822413 RepID=UPI003D65FD05
MSLSAIAIFAQIPTFTWIGGRGRPPALTEKGVQAGKTMLADLGSTVEEVAGRLKVAVAASALYFLPRYRGAV